MAAPALAQEQVKVRAGVHSDYNRIVFDWPGAPAYEIAQDGQILTLRFEAPAQVDLSSLQGQSLSNVTDVKQVSGETDNLSVTMRLAPQARVRDFKIGSRIIVDIYGGDAFELSQVASAPAQEPEIVQTETAQEETVPEIAQEAVQEQTETTEETAQADELEDVESVPLEPVPLDAHVITITSTRNVGMAVFERGPYFWIVIDDPDLTVDPQAAGPRKDLFETPLRQPVQGGVAYRYPLPQGAKVYSEGGGLLWRVVVTPNEREVKGFVPRREIDEASLYRGGSLILPMNSIGKVLRIPDPDYMDQIVAISALESAIHPQGVYEYPELITLPTAVGAAFVPLADNLSVVRIQEGMSIQRPGGLVLSRDRDVRAIELREQTASADGDALGPPPSADAPSIDTSPRIYRFKSWEMGGLKALEENKTILMSGIPTKDRDEQVEDLLTLAKLSLSNDRSYEALGYLRVAADTYPLIEDNPEYKALRGAANALAGRFEEAIEDLVEETLNPYGEIGYWKSFTLAGLEDWRQAASVLPASFNTLLDYPDHIKRHVGLYLAEVALRNGDTGTAQGLLGAFEPEAKEMSPEDLAAWEYLMGEALHQLDDTDGAKKYWEELIAGPDDLYRAKAGLSLTRLQLEENEIKPEEAIDRLEGLRYAWRGDELETLINYRLGQIYLENQNYTKGLGVLRNAVSLAPGSPMSKEVADFMTKHYRDLFLTDELDKVSPLDAVTIYEEFKELTPAGEEGDQFVQRLAERLVEADLLERAAALLDHQSTHRLSGADKVNVSIRLAAIRLLDGKPTGALRALDVAEEELKTLPEQEQAALREERTRDMMLLRARALSKMNKVEEAIALLDDMRRDTVVSRLIADVTWANGRWDEAADAFQDLILAEDISLTRPLTAYQTDLILNRAIALNLSGNRVALANLRERFGDSMKQTEKSQLFDVVTRPRQLGLIGSRESVSSLISEVDLFQDFLETYRTMQEGG